MVNYLLEFLELDWGGENVKFIKGKQNIQNTSHGKNRRLPVKMTLDELSSKKTWENIKN